MNFLEASKSGKAIRVVGTQKYKQYGKTAKVEVGDLNKEWEVKPSTKQIVYSTESTIDTAIECSFYQNIHRLVDIEDDRDICIYKYTIQKANLTREEIQEIKDLTT